MNNIWNYGQYNLDKEALLKYLQHNLDSYMNYEGYDNNQKLQFRDVVGKISKGISEGTITGDGYNNFNDATNITENNDVTSKAFNYLHTVANAMGKKFGSIKEKEKEKKTQEETPLQEIFDYNKHGLSYGFNKKYNPFGTDSTYDLWKSGFQSQEDLNNSLLDYIGLHKTNIQNSNYDFSKSLIDKDSYMNMLTDLENDIKTDGIKDSDQSKLKFLGLNPSSFIIQLEKSKDNPFGHILPDDQQSQEKLPEDMPSEIEGYKAILKEDGSYSYVPKDDLTAAKLEGELLASEYLEETNKKGFWKGFKDTDKMRMVSLALNLGAMFNPEPFSSAAMGFASDTLDLTADEMDGINDNWLDDIVNYGTSIFTAIPIAGDALSGYKAFKSLKKVAGVLAAAVGIYGAGMGIANADLIIQSINNIRNNVSNASVNDWRNVYTAVQIITGGINMGRSSINKTQAKNVTKNAEEALVVLLKNKGKTENYQFSGKDKEELLALKDNPEEFNKYIRENFEGLDNVEAASIKTTKGDLDWKNREHWYSTPKRKESTKTVNTETKPVYKQGQIPGKWDRARYFLNNNDEAIKPTKKLATEENPKTTTQETTLESRQEFSDPEENIVIFGQSPETDDLLESIVLTPEVKNQETPEIKEQVKVSAEEPIKTEETPDFSKAREMADEKPSVKATEIKPDIESKATESADIKSAVTKYNASHIRKESDKLKGKKKKKAKFTLKNAKLNEELEDLVKKDPSLASKEFNELLAILQRADKKTTYEQAFKMLTDAGYYKEGGVIKAELGIKTGTPRNLNPWYESIGNFFINDLLLGLKDNKYTYLDINAMLDRHYNIDKDLKDNVNNPTFNPEVQLYYTDINSHFNFVNNKGIKSGEGNSRYKVLQNPNTGDTFSGNWKADGYYSGRGQDRMLLGRSGDYSESELNEITNLWKNAGYEMYLDPETKYYKLKENLNNTSESLDEDIKETTMSEVVVTPQGSTNRTGNGGKKENELKIPKPEKPKSINEPFYTFDKVLETLGYFETIRHNKKQLDLNNKLSPLLYDPLEHHRSIYGDLRAIAEGNIAAGQIRNRASRPLTSDSNLLTASQLDAENLAQQYIKLGQLTDSEKMREMSELSWLQEKENKENRYNIAMKNRENMDLIYKEKLSAKAILERANYDSRINKINKILTWFAKKQNKEEIKRQELEEKNDMLFNRNMATYIRHNPQEYIPNWKAHEDLWNRYNNGEALSANELKIISLIQSRLQDAYYHEIYGSGDYFGFGIPKAPWEPLFKKGGKITKNQVDVIIKYLKESNNNYNKAIDRSVKGLYNHIKLQRRK